MIRASAQLTGPEGPHEVPGAGQALREFFDIRFLVGLIALIAITAVIFLLQQTSDTLLLEFGLSSAGVLDGEWYRLLTSGFLHVDLDHLARNMSLAFVVGLMLGPAIGGPRFFAVYVVSILAGSLGSLIMLSPDAISLGASGGVYGITTAAVVMTWIWGFALATPEIRIEAAFKWMLFTAAVIETVALVLSFWFDGTLPSASTSAHVFGAVGGLLCAVIVFAGDAGMLGRVLRRTASQLYAMAALGAGSVAASLIVA